MILVVFIKKGSDTDTLNSDPNKNSVVHKYNDTEIHDSQKTTNKFNFLNFNLKKSNNTEKIYHYMFHGNDMPLDALTNPKYLEKKRKRGGAFGKLFRRNNYGNSKYIEI